MRRLLLPALVVLATAGCAGVGEPLPRSEAAPPQSAELDWVEAYAANGAQLVFRVRRLEVTEQGWSADISVTNRTPSGFGAGDPATSASWQWGVMLFRTGELEEVDERNSSRDLPGTRLAQRFEPALPLLLEPGVTWSGTISARGALAAGRFVRVVFGPLVAVEPLEDFPDPLVWITDHAYELRGG